MKGLKCGIKAISPKCYDVAAYLHILRCTHLKLALLLHKAVLVNFPMVTTVDKQTFRLKYLFRFLKNSTTKVILMHILIYHMVNSSWF